MTIDMPTDVKTIPVSQLVLQGHLAGELVANFSENANLIRAAQQGVAEGLFRAVIVNGLRANGYVYLQILLEFDPSNGHSTVQMRVGENKSWFAQVSPKMEDSLVLAIRTMRDMGLTPEVRFIPSQRLLANPELDRQTDMRFGLRSSTMPPLAPGVLPAQSARVSPSPTAGSPVSVSHSAESPNLNYGPGGPPPPGTALRPLVTNRSQSAGTIFTVSQALPTLPPR